MKSAMPAFVWYLLGMVFGTGNAMLHLASNQALQLGGVAMMALSAFLTMAILFSDGVRQLFRSKT